VARFIGYPSRQVLAVFEDGAAADRASAALGSAGVDASKVERYNGQADADRFDATGRHHGPVEKALRAIQFGLMDQLPAMAWYESALRTGRTVIAVHVDGRKQTLRAVTALRDAGGHYINGFGRLETEQFEPWRGPEPPIASLMKH